MKKTLDFIFLLCILALLNSCKGNDFEIISEDIKLVEKSEIDTLLVAENLPNAEKEIDKATSDSYSSNSHEIKTFSDRLKEGFSSDSKEITNYNKKYDQKTTSVEEEKLFQDFINNNRKEDVKAKIEKFKGLQSKISVQNNSNQIIETSNLTVIINFIFENEKKFFYKKNYNLLQNDKIWNKKETIHFDIIDVVNYLLNDIEKNTLKIHIPKNVTIDYFISAKNSINFNNAKDGYGYKLLSKDITDLWNGNNKSENIKQIDQKPKNGDLDKSFVSQENSNEQKEEKYKKEKQKLILEGWKDEDIQNGQLSSCYNFKPTKGSIENKLEVIVGGGTDVSIKIMNMETEKCIRYVFINSKTTHSIKNIPEGKYYLKIAYGKDWLSKVQNGQCVGKFIKNPLYEKGDDILNFNIQKNRNGRSIPSYQLSLDIVSSGISNSFNSQNITESDFNK